MFTLRLVLLFVPVSMLAQTPVDSAWSLLKAATESNDADQRQQAIAAVTLAGATPRAIDLIERRLNDRQPEVRQAAASALGEIRAVSAIPRLKAALDDNQAVVVIAAAKALADLGDASGQAVLEDVLAGRPIRKGDGFIKSEIKSQMNDARKQLHHPSTLAFTAVREVSGVFLPFGIPFGAIHELTKDTGAAARTIAVNGLAENKDPATIHPLEQALVDRNWVVRAAAVRALVQRRVRGAVSALQISFVDKNPQVRLLAAAAVVRLSD